MNLVRALFGGGQRAGFESPGVQVGEDLAFDGTPTVEAMSGGRIEIGDRFSLSSLPVPSHLIAGGVLRIGHDVSIAHGAAVAATTFISIGDRTRIGAFFVVMDTDFHGERAQRGARPTTDTPIGPDSGFAPVSIGADVHIESNVTVLRGSIIGDGARIAAGSVVNGRIAAGAFASGVPARAAGESAEGSEGALTARDVTTIVGKVFGLSDPPDANQGPADIPEWDSLGSLKLLLALEEAFGLTLDEDLLAAARTVGDVQSAVESARQRTGTRP